MKKILTVFLILMLGLSLASCRYHPPEGWTPKHHTYEEVLAFAKSIDPCATVKFEYSDAVDEYDWKYREWEAVINGRDCHVSSVSDWVWNEGFLAGEFAQTYYRIDTDYDYIVMQSILSENYPEWKCGEGIRSKYHANTNMIRIELTMAEFRMLNDDELEQIWKIACEINAEYEKLTITRKVGFGVPAPACYLNHHGEMEYFVKKDSYTYIAEFTEEGKKAFLQEYEEDWALLESGLPVYD